MQNGCGRCELNHVDDIYKTQALNSGKIGWVIDNYSHMLYAKPEIRLLQWIIAIAQPIFRGWGPPLRGGIVICLARALRALGARQHVIGLTELVPAANVIARNLHFASTQYISTFLPSLQIEMAQVVEILPQISQVSTSYTVSLQCMLMTVDDPATQRAGLW